MTDVFSIQVAPGRIIKVQANSPEEAAQGARRVLENESRGTSDNMAQAFGQGATMGFGDEAVAGVRAAFPEASNWMMSGPALQRDESIGGSPTPQTVSTAPDIGTRYDEELARERAKAKQFHETNPVLSTGAKIGGGVASTGLLLPNALVSGGGLALNMGRGAALGAALGGATGYGEGEGGTANRLANAGPAAAVGAGVGAAAPVAGAVASAAYQRAAPYLLGKVADVAERFTPKVPAVPLSAAAPEGGQAVGDSLATRLADNSRIAARNVENDAALQRIAQLLRGDRINPGTALSTLEGMGDEAFIADLGRNVQRGARDAYVLPGEGQTIVDQAFTNRNNAAPRRMISAFEGGHPYPTISEATENIQNFVTDEGRRLYDPVLRGDARLNISPEMAEQQSVPLVRDAYATMRRLFAEAGVTPTDAELAHSVKQGLATNAEAARTGGRPVAPHLVSGVEANWRRAFHEANPRIRAADETYGPIAGLPERLAEGQNFLKTGLSETAADFSPSALSRRIPGMTPMERDVVGVGAVNTARDIAAQGLRQTRALADKIATSDPEIGIAARLPHILPRQANDIIRNARTEGVFTRTDRAVRGGAADRAGDIQAAFSGLGGIPSDARGIAARVLDQVGKIAAALREPNEASRAEIARLLTSGDRQTNAQTLALVQELMRRPAATRSYSSGLAGGAGGSFASSP